MANPFDKFDDKSKENPFDKFDAQAAPQQEKKPQDDLPFMRRFFQGWRDPIAGGAQLLEQSLPSGVSQSINEANNWLADKTGLVAKLPAGGVTEFERGIEQEYQKARGKDAGFDAARLTGNVINPTNIAIASKIPKAASLAGRIGLGAAVGGASAALNPALDEESSFWDQKVKQSLMGAAFGGALPIVGAGLSRLVSPKASTNPQLQSLMAEGVKPTIGQALGGTVGRIEEKLQSLPIMGDAISKARNAAAETFRTATFNRALKPIDLELPKGVDGRDAIAFTEKALGAKYDDVLSKIGAIPTDKTFNANVGKLTEMVNKMMMPADEKQKFMQAINNMAQSMDKRGVLTSDAYKALESSLSRDSRVLGASQNIYEGKLAPAVAQLKVELQGLLKRQAGSHADDLKDANAGWANFKRVQRAAASVGAENGNFTPAQFQSAVKALSGSKDKAAFARGGALGQDLGDAGKSILSGKIADSGTAGRLAMGAGALGSGMINPAIPASLIAGAGAYSSPAQNFLRYLAATRPQNAQSVANQVNQFTPIMAPFVGGLLQTNNQ